MMASISPVTLEIQGVPPTHVSPGTDLSCAVRIRSLLPVQITDCRAVFQHIRQHAPPSHELVAMPSDSLASPSVVNRLVNNRQIHVLARKVMVSKDEQQAEAQEIPEEKEREEALSLMVPIGIADTWDGTEGKHGSNRYQIVAEVTFMRRVGSRNRVEQREGHVKTVKEVLVRNRLNVALAGGDDQALLRTAHAEKVVRASLAWRKGKVMATVTIPRPNLVLGENIRMHINISNQTTRTIRYASLSLYQRLALTEHMVTRPVDELIRTVAIPHALLSPGGQWVDEVASLKVPDSCLTNASFKPHCPVQVGFFVRLKLTWRFGSLKCYVDVDIGTERDARRLGKDNVQCLYQAGVHRYAPNLEAIAEQEQEQE